MSSLSELFTGFPDFVDYRQDQLLEVLGAIQTLRAVSSTDPNELIRTISTLNLPRVHRNYANKCNEVANGNRQLSRSISGVSFRSFKAVMGADDYV